jgi:hypothetical protein
VVTHGSHKVVMWLCPIHGSYPMEIRTRANSAAGCPQHQKEAARPRSSRPREPLERPRDASPRAGTRLSRRHRDSSVRPLALEPVEAHANPNWGAIRDAQDLAGVSMREQQGLRRRGRASESGDRLSRQCLFRARYPMITLAVTRTVPIAQPTNFDLGSSTNRSQSRRWAPGPIVVG